ncbi:serine/threonine-protein kinase [Nocardioides sp.]|uniref:serine/threonine-protein kinase n=1 Tax=Nocardioides sp. TaxID=35761 RepID=UPI00263848E3|nr:serine/threonine-protein kinase [Nocardioides sp.]
MQHLGRYRLDSVIGVGAFATVWRAYDDDLDVEVAVKVLADNWAHHADVRERFLDEARILRQIRDPRVVRVHDIGESGDRPYFVMDFLPGGTLNDAIASDRTPSRALHLAAEAARAVQALHDAGVLHRDVKPANLLLDADGGVHVSDLGSAKRLAEASGYTVVTGTPSFMAPEQALGQPLDGRSDVYSLGVMTYEFLTGRLPFASALGRTASDRPPATGAGAAVDRYLSSALALRPAERPASPGTFAAVLENLSDGHAPRRDLNTRVVLAASTLSFSAAAGLTWLILHR